MNSAPDDKKTKQLFFVSFGTDVRQCKELYWSAQLMDLEVIFFGFNQPWAGFQMKLLAVKEFIQQLEKKFQPEEVVICFVDGYDVIFADSRSNILAKFESFNKPFVISAEKYLNPDSSRSMQRVYRAVNSPSQFKYLNSGTYIGTLAEIKKFITWCGKYNYNCPAANGKRYGYCDDQRALTTYFFQHPEVCVLDHEQKMFSCLAGCSFKQTLAVGPDGRVRNLVTATDTSIIHLNGRSKRHKRKLLAQIKNQLCSKIVEKVKKSERIKVLKHKLKSAAKSERRKYLLTRLKNTITATPPA